MNTERQPTLPTPRGPISAEIVTALQGEPRALRLPNIQSSNILADDTQLALTCCYELHYESFVGVDEGWDWAPELLVWRDRLEQAFRRQIEETVGASTPIAPRDVIPTLVDLARSDDGPSLSRFIDVVEPASRVVHTEPF